MDTISFDRLLLKTAFCCMACDGSIDTREVELIRTMCQSSPHFEGFNLESEINPLIYRLNTEGKAFISYYFDLLTHSSLSNEEELSLIEFAINTIKADDLVEYTEIKFFKAIRSHLKISDEEILAVHPDVELFLEEDLATDSKAGKFLNQYLEVAEFPVLEKIDLGNYDGLKTHE